MTGNVAQPSRVVIVGGGPSGLSTAFHLLDDNPRADEVELTLYQLGWRLGGKGATGRSPGDERILEHGIHAFTGFYWNALATLDRAYGVAYGGDADIADRGRLARTIEEALVPSDFAALVNYVDNGTRMSPIRMKTDAGTPWVEVPDLSSGAAIEAVAGWATAQVRGLLNRIEAEGLLGRIATIIPWLIERRIERELERAMGHARAARHDELLASFDRMLGWLTDRALSDRYPHWTSLYPLFLVADLYRTILSGIIVDGLFTETGEVDTIDHLNYTEWLATHGLHPATMESTFPHAPALICFSLPDGDSSQTPTMSAATYLLWQLRDAFNEGHQYYFFQAGTGDTVVTPMYRALERLGVEFEFFHKLVAATPSADGEMIDELVFEIQARTIDGKPYEPLRPAGGGLGSVWPDQPRWEQLEQADEIRDALGPSDAVGGPHANLESAWCPWTGVGRKVLRRGVDFDLAVIALPPAAIAASCPELLADPLLQGAHDALPSVQTLQLQLWFDSTVADLGWNQAMAGTDRFTTIGLPDPLNGAVDYSDLIGFESWPEPGPKGQIQMCGPIQDMTSDDGARSDDPTYPDRMAARADAISGQFLRTFGISADRASGDRPNNPRSLDFSLLHDPGSDRTGEARLDNQYVRINIDPSERYVLAPKGSAAHRPSPWASRFRNIAVAGDWVYTGMNIGSFESAVMGGALAAYAVSGSPAPTDIPGYDLFHHEPPTNDGPCLLDRDLPPAPETIDLREDDEADKTAIADREAHG
jgi:uncharacterized protein with NAD-binding domain and iron-sulfur cluster